MGFITLKAKRVRNFPASVLACSLLDRRAAMGCALMGWRGCGALVTAAPLFTAPALLLQPPVSQLTRAVTGRDAGWGFGGE